MNICPNTEAWIGNTPLVSLSRLTTEGNCRLLGKLELCNPGGSSKDRIAAAMINQAEAKGLLTPGATVIEPTSGNTGIALAMVCACRGYRCLLVMPDSMSRERMLLMEAYGAEVVLTPGALGMAGAVTKAQTLARQIPGSWIPQQFRNPANPAAHYAATGPEIWRDSGGKVDIFVAGVGTGGTLSGAGAYLRTQNPELRIVAVEPAESPLLSAGFSGNHSIQGIGPNFLPEILDTSLIDEVITVTDAQARDVCRRLARQAGILAGISSGAALQAAIMLSQKPEHEGKTIVTILPDTGLRYLSTGLFQS